MRRKGEDEALRRQALPQAERLSLLEADNARLDGKWRGSIRAIGAMVVLLVVLGLIYGKHIDANTSDVRTSQGLAAVALKRASDQTGELRAYEIASCHRGNERTLAENRSGLAIWRFFSTTATLLKAALAQPEQPQTARQVGQTRAFIKGLEDDAGAIAWHHFVEDCVFAVDHPEAYRLPPAVHFSKQQPPKGALRLAPGE